MKIKLAALGVFLFWSCASAQPAIGDALTDCGKPGEACVLYGAQTFQERCTLCHGAKGHGDGVMPLLIKGYPNTNLMKSQQTDGVDEIRTVVQFGGSLESVSTEMPPWGDELTFAQLESVSLFIDFLRNNRDAALAMLEEAGGELQPSMRLGRGVFQGRCSLCHGRGGEGDGKMARIIKDPPPFNLTKSIMPDAYLEMIIKRGGAEIGRSSRMPPFGGDLSDQEIASVVMYIKGLRVDEFNEIASAK